MIEFESFSLDNGLEVLVHEDHSSPIAVMNILYDVGAKDEDKNKTGFAHLFEHLMFGGSKNVPSYDEPLQRVGGENNAFTTNDITNYYLSVPSANLETAFWLESDRMLGLSFDQKVLDTQKKVVIEEFKQHYLNQPYGDVWLDLRPLAYKVHPYQWATIGKNTEQIDAVEMEDVKHFFYKFYRPNNAVMVLAGDVNLDQTVELSQKWFGSIPSGKNYLRNLPKEPQQSKKRTVTIQGDVPLDAIYMSFHMPRRLSKEYFIVDLLGDILGRGKTSRLYKELVYQKKMFNQINSYVTGSTEPGLLIIHGKLNSEFSLEQGESSIEKILHTMITTSVPEPELQKVKNQAESDLIFSEMEVLTRAMSLAYAANMGDAHWINKEARIIQSVTVDEIQHWAKITLQPSNSSVLYYKTK